MSELLGYFYIIPVLIAAFLVLWVVRARQNPTMSKWQERRECEEKRKQRDDKATIQR